MLVATCKGHAPASGQGNGNRSELMEKKGEKRLVVLNRLGYMPGNIPASLNAVYLPCLTPVISNPTSTRQEALWAGRSDRLERPCQ